MYRRKKKKPVLKLLLKLLFFLFALLFAVLLIFYMTAPVYKFSEPKAFAGKYWYNPYQSMNPELWRKYNFQVQSKAWGGLTNGRLNSNILIDSIYHELGYDYVATSDYQKINYHGSELPSFIPTYEHGYSIRKTHQVCIGASKVLWIDYPFYQNLSMKQGIIDKLQKSTELIALAHPKLLGGYKLSDMKYLSGYQLMEVLNNLRVSVEHWDMALSNGHRIYMLANDDAHNVSNSNEVGRRFTMINAENLNREEIIRALDSGNSYGFDFFRIDDEPMTAKVERSKHIPYLLNASLRADTFDVAVSQKAIRIRFIGQNGRELSLARDTSTATYVLKPTDTYVRTEITFADLSVMYLNPLTRHADEDISRQRIADVDDVRTLLFRAIYLVAIIVLLQTIYRYQIRRKQKNYR